MPRIPISIVALVICVCGFAWLTQNLTIGQHEAESTMSVEVRPATVPGSLQRTVVDSASQNTVSRPNQTELGKQASRFYEIVLPEQWTWYRDSAGMESESTFGMYGSPLFNESFSAADSSKSRLRLVLQSNLRQELAPLFPWNGDYCLSEVPVIYRRTTLSAMVYSALSTTTTTKIVGGLNRVCTETDKARFADQHFIELRVCVDTSGNVSRPSSEPIDFVLCPQSPEIGETDYLRFNLSCEGLRWAGAKGQRECVALLQEIISSLEQHRQ